MRETMEERHLNKEIKRLKKLGIHLKPEFIYSYKEHKYRHDISYQGIIYIWKKQKNKTEEYPSDEDKKEAEERFPLGFGEEMKAKCGYCGDEYDDDPTFTDKDRRKEYQENFPNDPDMHWGTAVICEDCYQKFKKWLDKLTPKQRKQIEIEEGQYND